MLCYRPMLCYVKCLLRCYVMLCYVTLRYVIYYIILLSRHNIDRTYLITSVYICWAQYAYTL